MHIIVKRQTFDGGVWNVRSSQLNLVDLAGSERQKYTKTEGLRLKVCGPRYLLMRIYMLLKKEIVCVCVCVCVCVHVLKLEINH